MFMMMRAITYTDEVITLPIQRYTEVRLVITLSEKLGKLLLLLNERCNVYDQCYCGHHSTHVV